MRTNTELTLIALLAVQIAFFSWPVPKIVTDIFHTGVGRLAGLLGVAYLAKQQSAALAILAAILQARATQAAQNENFTEGVANPPATSVEEQEGNRRGPQRPSSSVIPPPPPATSGNVPASAGSSANAQPASSGVTENFEPFSGF